jgi:type IV pilus assembly protein PilW
MNMTRKTQSVGSAFRGKHPHRQGQTGFGMVELLVAVALGLIIIAGVVSLFVNNQRSFATNESMARLQENARISFELMAREVRQAGGNACGARVYANMNSGAHPADPAVTPIDWQVDWENGTVVGYGSEDTIPGVTTGTAATNHVEDTDAIKVLSGASGDTYDVTAHVPSTQTITLDGKKGPAANDLVMICDSRTAALFTASKGTTVVDDYEMGHAATNGAGTAVNCGVDLAYPTNCDTATGAREFKVGSKVNKLTAAIWYVGYNGRGGKSLFRLNEKDTAEEIAEGVEDLQLDYLTRNLSSGLLATEWKRAKDDDSITDGVDDWAGATNEVVAVRIKLTLATVANIGTDNQPIKREMIYVANLRNRTL